MVSWGQGEHSRVPNSFFLASYSNITKIKHTSLDWETNDLSCEQEPASWARRVRTY